MIAKRHCPVCNSTHTRRVFALDPGLAGSMVIPDNPGQSLKISKEIESLWQSDHCEFYSCSQCRYGFAWPYTAGNMEIYSALYYRAFSFPSDKWEYDRAIEIISHADLRADSALLEIGAGNGSFLEKVSPLIQDRNRIHSTEYSGPGVEEIQRKGFKCYSKSISQLAEGDLPRFDVICMFQVLEHMDDLDLVFQSLGKLGNRGSNLIVAVPNGTLRRFYDRMGVHLDVPPIHVGRFTPETFQWLGKKHGWNVAGTSIEPQKYLFKVKKFVFDRYWRLRFSRRTEQSGQKLIVYFFRYLLVILLSIRYMPVLIYLLLPGTGTSLLVHLQRLNEPR